MSEPAKAAAVAASPTPPDFSKDSDADLFEWMDWAYMVMTALAWNLKAWWALWPIETPGRWNERHCEEKTRVLGMEFKTFVNAFVRLPCQIIRSGRRLVYRILGWNNWQPLFFRTFAQLRL